MAGGGPDSQGERGLHVISLMEVMWKVVADILNFRLATSITYHDFLHGFWAGRSTGTATIEAKLL